VSDFVGPAQQGNSIFQVRSALTNRGISGVSQEKSTSLLHSVIDYRCILLGFSFLVNFGLAFEFAEGEDGKRKGDDYQTKHHRSIGELAGKVNFCDGYIHRLSISLSQTMEIVTP